MTVTLDNSAPPSQDSVPQLRIAIVGAGLVGSAAIVGLSKLPNTSVVAFEKAPDPREGGAWISLTSSAFQALANLVPLSDINNIVYRPVQGGDYQHRHWRTGELMHGAKTSPHIRPEFAAARTTRPTLHATILKRCPPDTIRYGHRVTGVQIQDDGRARLDFDNGDDEGDFDLVVAADGLYSPIRRKYHPNDSVKYQGVAAYRSVFPKERLAPVAHLLNPDTSVWWGPGGEMIFLSELGLGTYGIIVILRDEEEVAKSLRWESEHTLLDKLRTHFAKWDPVVPAVLDLLPDIQALPLESGPWLESLTQDGRVVFVGDAAHPTAGAYGAGAGMGYADAWGLYCALSGMSTGQGTGTSYDVPAALQVFDKARLPFLHRVAKQFVVDEINGKYIAAAKGDEEEWIKRFKETAPARIKWLVEHDVELEVIKQLGEKSFT
ncbi:FAD-dependent monooxygenase sorC [Vanrija pseudolonga]|uniref:FAD-dependent monooxygenase sorC n=1 Tax=Vanrija pseudolonga TaxID=143232 RepID=A0AAF0Y601_9TREE|nr:FAD-dependent monooxygenase sorC [Vanrija pseudolonga]